MHQGRGLKSWATRLVGRDAEIAELGRAYRRAAAGEFSSVLLLADPGIGKTRLARESWERLADDVQRPRDERARAPKRR